MEIKIQRENRKSIRLSVKYPNFLVQAPYHVRQQDIEMFIQKHQHWMNYQEQLQTVYHPKLKDGSFLFWLGKKVKVVKTSESIFKIDGDVLYRGNQNQRVLERLLNDYKKEQLHLVIKDLINKLQLTHQFSYNTIRVKNLTASWGRTQSDQTMTFSSRLIHYPLEFIESVVAHEVAHLKVLNHSPDFYQHLTTIYPKYKSIQKKYQQFQFMEEENE